MRLPSRTRVGIVGAGPAGLLLARLLHRAGVDCVVLESREREYVEQRQRAGILEQATVDALRGCGAAERLDREGLAHDGIELRWNRRAYRVDFPSLTGGRRVWVYAQTEVVKDLIALDLAAGVPLAFAAPAVAVTGADTDRPVVHYRHRGRERTLACDYLVGCDGFHGIVRAAVPAAARTTYERLHPYSWLGVLADVPPSCDELIYARSPRGFALHSLRSTTVSRLYLQVANGTDPEAWSDERIWDELDNRFAVEGDWRLRRGPITQKSVLPMRGSVTAPMRYGSVFLAGDAAHIVPPTGAKGLNLAAGDVTALGRAFAARYADGSDRLLAAYSDSRLDRVRRAQEFSYSLTTMLHTDPGGTDFDARLQVSRLERIAESRAARAELAENYVGPPSD
ncbi:4-hydroxybenzoate 3-monooxygenase [Streptomyces sp. NPDC088258]|uniref:4-hydroxybenzoate 3-monooxygenase n=1 Tax=Streptomyces sp. NPDC088258 TaxID=3365849 RepID=UPI00381770FD